MLCKNCNQYIPENNAYCPNCGCVCERVNTSEAIETKKSKTKIIVIAAVVALLVVIVSVAIIISLQPPTAEEVYEMVSPSIVEITGNAPTGTSTGTGFFYDESGTVITNYHVIEDCTSASITTSSGATYKVTQVLKYSEEKDIAILSTTRQTSVPLKIRTTEIKTGETVYAIGSSLGLTGTLSNGIISSATREVDGNIYIQTTAPISHGNSGGPLLDEDGYVIGITTAYFADGQNLNLAIPISQVETLGVQKPSALDFLFKQEIEWISKSQFFYYEEEETFVLLFELADKNEVPMSSSGTVDIRIVNDNGVLVYEKSKSFTDENFENWIQGETEEHYLGSISIAPSEIADGTTSYGTVYFEVYGDDYYFDESTLTVSGLPMKENVSSVSVRTITLSEEVVAQNIYNEWRNGEVTESSLIAIMDVYGENQGGGMLHVIEPGKYVDELNSWCFDAARKVGDSAIIKNDYGYTIIYISALN